MSNNENINQNASEQPQTDVVNSQISDVSKELNGAEDESRKQLLSDLNSFVFGKDLTSKLSKNQIEFCRATAMTWGLNPLKREIHFVPYEVYAYDREAKKKLPTGKFDVNIVIGYESYIKRAEASGRMKGWKLEMKEDGQFIRSIKKRNGESWEKKYVNYKAVLTIHRDDWTIPFVYEDWMDECYQDSPVWWEKPKFMFKKTVISKGFRLCFTKELGGMPYTPEELGVGAIDDNKKLDISVPEPDPPASATLEQLAKLEKLYIEKDKNPKRTLAFFKKKDLTELSKVQADKVIKGLEALQDTNAGNENVDPDEVIKEMDEQEVETVVTPDPEEEKRRAGPASTDQGMKASKYIEAIKKKNIEPVIAAVDVLTMTVGDYEDLWQQFKSVVMEVDTK